MWRKVIFSLIATVVLFNFFAITSIVNADCKFDNYRKKCTGSCSCPSGTIGVCICKVNLNQNLCMPDTSNCETISNTPPAPTTTFPPYASPTQTPFPTTAGEICSPQQPYCSNGTAYCMKIKCGCDCNGNNCIPGCSSSCLLGNDNKYHCYTTYNADVKCGTPPPAKWSAWQCLSGQEKCAACANQGYICAVRYCTNPSNSNDYQITCGCPNDSGGNEGGTNPQPTNTIPPTFTSTPTFTPTPTFGPWIRLQRTSFYSNKALVMPIPNTVIPYDTDDDSSKNFINTVNTSYESGIVSASSINLGYGQPSVSGWKTTSSSNNLLTTAETFIQYAKSRLNPKKISSISQIQSENLNNQIVDIIPNQPNQYQPIIINQTDISIFNNRNLVIITENDLIINATTFTPINANIAFITKNDLVFSNDTTRADGIFIAKNINTGATTNQGLKIFGNIIAQENFINNRRVVDLRSPTVFIIFQQNQYLKLLPYLGIVNYEWKQEN